VKESALIQRNRKRELRTLYRNKRLEYEQLKRPPCRREREASEARIDKELKDILQADNKKPGKPDKKPGPNLFLDMYSFISSTAFDSRYNISSSWKPQSFNERKQHLEFLRCFVYPYSIPEVLIWASHASEFVTDMNGRRIKAPYYNFIRLAKGWINDIMGGKSFYKLNRQFFTKMEAHFFLSAEVPYTDPVSVLKLYFYAKSRAHSMNHKQSMIIANVFTIKFQNCFRNKHVIGFLELLARTPQYGYESSMLGDISDFVLSKINEKKKTFSFSGRTITSVIKLANEWHEEIRRETEARRNQADLGYRGRFQANLNEKSVDTSHWKGMNVAQFRYKIEDYTWTVTELKTAQDLVNEGRKMKNCVASYANKCVSGNCSIFSLEILYPTTQIIEKMATLEVTPISRTLVQAKGKCNSTIAPKLKSVVIRWARENRIKVGI